MMKKFYRTMIVVEVLSEEPYNPDTLDDVAHDIVHGDVSGQWSVQSAEEVDEPTMAELMLAQGSAPEFFGIDV